MFSWDRPAGRRSWYADAPADDDPRRVIMHERRETNVSRNEYETWFINNLQNLI